MSREFMHSPSLTILMPTYNAASYINEAIDSILQQTFTDFQLWVIDDASTDDSLNIARKFTDARLHRFSNQQNQGKIRTINEYAKKITTAFFTITDADDVSHPDRLQRQLNLFQQDPELMMCGTSFWAMTRKGNVFRKMVVRSSQTDLQTHAVEQSQFMGPTTIMRKEILNVFPELYRLYFESNQEDADLSSRILSRYKTTNLLEPLYCYRILSSSISRKEITVWNLTVNRLIGQLYAQRQHGEKDWLEKGETEKADAFMEDIAFAYKQDSSFVSRHTAFFNLYWGLIGNALFHICAAIKKAPLQPKNYISLGYIILRSGLFYLNQGVNKKHYSSLINRTS
jgi:glycosyltransferase involved in cell wall biosynthesis